jgi:predicted benzoate:H+ symporter BenE
MGAISSLGVNITLALLGAILIYAGLRMLDSLTGLFSLLVGLICIYFVLRWAWKTWFARGK